MRIASAIASVALVLAFVGCKEENKKPGEATVSGAPVNAPPAQPQPAIQPAPVDTTNMAHEANTPGATTPPATHGQSAAATPPATGTAKPKSGSPKGVTPKESNPPPPPSNPGAANLPKTGTLTVPKGSIKPYPCQGNQVSFTGPGKAFCANVCRNDADCPGAGAACDGAGTSVDRNGLVSTGSKYCSRTKK